MMLDIIFFALLAGFILTRLFKILGQHDENDERTTQHHDNLMDMLKAKQDSQSADLEIASALEASLPQDFRNIFDELRKYNPSMDAETFINGARRAFETILEAYRKHDLDTIKALTDSSVYQAFEQEIKRRKESGLVHDNTLIGITSAEITNMSKEGNIVYITVKFISEQMYTVRDKEGQLLDGSASRINEVKDIWTFAKKAGSTEKLWKLVGTSSE